MKTNTYVINDAITFVPKQYSVASVNKVLRLTSKETELLALLCHSPDSVLCRRTTQDCLWKDQEGADVSLNRTVLLLRRKFQSLVGIELIKTIPRVGYIIDGEVRITAEESDENSLSTFLPRTKVSNTVTISILVTLSFLVGAFFMKDEISSVLFKNGITKSIISPSLTLYSTEGRVASSYLDKIKSINGEDINFFIGPKAISFVSIVSGTGDSRLFKQAIYFRRVDAPLEDDLQCVINSINNGGFVTFKKSKKNELVNRYKMRFYQRCDDTDSWLNSVNTFTSVNVDGKDAVSMDAIFSNEQEMNILRVFFRGNFTETLGQNILYIDKSDYKMYLEGLYLKNPLLIQLKENRIYTDKLNIIRAGDGASLSSYLGGVMYIY